MKIILKKLSLLNFKGVREKTIEFSEDENCIYGQNTSGKTTLLDAFLWVTFGKDSSGRTDFEIKTLDRNNKPFHKLSHEVTAMFLVDDQEIELRKLFKEKWVKKRGSAIEEFSGHEKEFYWNGVPLKESEFNQKVDALFNESVFKILSNTTFFNSLKWQDRRTVLLEIAGTISDGDVLDKISTVDNKFEVAALTTALNQKKTIDEFRAEIGAKKKRIKEEIILIPARIDEAQRGLPESEDYDLVRSKMENIQTRIETIEKSLMDQSSLQKEAQDKIKSLYNKRQLLTSKLTEIEYALKNKIQDQERKQQNELMDLQRNFQDKSQDLSRLIKEVESEKNHLQTLINSRDKLRVLWSEEDGKQLEFNEDEFNCPACKRALEHDDVEAKKAELISNFNLSKSQKIAEISQKGKNLASDIEATNAKIENLESRIKSLESEVKESDLQIQNKESEIQSLAESKEFDVTNALNFNSEYQLFQKEIESVNAEIDNAGVTQENPLLQELIQEKKDLVSELSTYQTKLGTRDLREKMLTRIDELTKQEEHLAQELATQEGIEFCIQQFQKERMMELENRVNSRFSLVRFKMFEEQINGGEKEACVTLINGVPYADANTASKIQAGLDIINTLSNHYQIQAPVWVDNRESVTTLPETDCQLISLIVSPNDKELRVQRSSKLLAEVA